VCERLSGANSFAMPVNHEIAMGELHRRADLHEQLKAFADE
jgi:hypothetical protein